MSDRHPDEQDLLAYAEDDLSGAARAAVHEHVTACGDCLVLVRELETARTTLRGAPELELPPRRRERMAAALAAQPERRVYVSPLRLATVLAPLAALAAVVAVVANVDGEGDDQGGRPEAVRTLAPTEAAEGGGGAEGAGEPGAGPALVARVAGTPSRVAKTLRAQGFNVRTEGAAVFVVDPEEARLTRALARLGRGRVEVFVETTGG